MKKVLDWLLDQGLNINAPSEEAHYSDSNREGHDNAVGVLNRAATYDDVDILDHLVARGAEPTHSNALHHAAMSFTMVAYLIGNYKLDVNADDSRGGLNAQTLGSGPWGCPLNYPVSNSNLLAVESLLKYGAEVGDSPAIAISKGHAPSLKLPLDHGADSSEALDTAVRMDFVDSCKPCL
ncbi:uncharacterized protein TRUGW13939_04694 [Talaromyces rugulosus]|uniref:Uncharacterized protein n=1 Tax=Talaromyces rugulosus TaxID=121627 RepID=A0A7H8QUV3_TALRU|nr:uncharacterized protein TRUGW13939_04694 [Talaromyces rugulosus]QKX57576.1 hypothetical protein TRUGW13939_04694 [Talaromyces rugulosus]